MTRQISRFALMLGLAALTGFAAPATQAETLTEFLSEVYRSNPEITAERAALRATDELEPQARAGYMPTVNMDISATETHSNDDVDGGSRLSNQTASLTANQFLYRGGRTMAGIKQAQALIRAQRAQLTTVEQAVLLEAATSYYDVVRDQAVVKLTQNNVRVLGEQLQAANDRFEVGEVTRTDVAQAVSRVERAKADRETALGQLQISRAALFRLVGRSPEGALIEPGAVKSWMLPATLEEAVGLAEAQNPIVLAARNSHDASEYGIDLARGQLLPEVAVVGQLQAANNPSAFTDEQTSASVSVQASIPLYQAGAVHSQIREAKETASENFISIEQALRTAREQAIASWESLMSSRATIRSRKAQVRASELALEGVREESIVGSRTTLDVLDAEQELLDAEVSLVRAERDEWAAITQLLSATGQLSPEILALDVEPYNPDEHYDRVHKQYWGTATLEEELPRPDSASMDDDFMTLTLDDGEMLPEGEVEDMSVVSDEDMQLIRIKEGEAEDLTRQPPPEKPDY
ncbi:MAG: TolC family outer membrane protein [Alphaproteobacteria bacterium]